MARKMYREAIDMYREGAPDSAILANKTGSLSISCCSLIWQKRITSGPSS